MDDDDYGIGGREEGGREGRREGGREGGRERGRDDNPLCHSWFASRRTFTFTS